MSEATPTEGGNIAAYLAKRRANIDRFTPAEAAEQQASKPGFTLCVLCRHLAKQSIEGRECGTESIRGLKNTGRRKAASRALSSWNGSRLSSLATDPST